MSAVEHVDAPASLVRLLRAAGLRVELLVVSPADDGAWDEPLRRRLRMALEAYEADHVAGLAAQRRDGRE